jgi:hypothetical protein
MPARNEILIHVLRMGEKKDMLLWRKKKALAERPSDFTTQRHLCTV